MQIKSALIATVVLLGITAKAQTTPLSHRQLCTPHFMDAVVRIEAGGQSRGSGFLVTKDGYIFTANQDESDLFLFLLGTGARDQEAQHACWSDVDFHNRIFTVKEHPEYNWEPKDKQRREIELADNVLAMLKARKARSKTELIFTAPLGGLRGHLLRDMVEPVARRAGVEDAGLHRFRKS